MLPYTDIRHVDKLNLKFMVNESACVIYLKSNNDNPAISNMNPVININNEIIEHYKLVFEQLWCFGIDATKKVQDIETEIDLAPVMDEIDKKGIKQFVGKLINTSKHEVMFYTSTLWGINNFISKDLFGPLQSMV
jgi:hypothetical protein